MSQTFFGRPVGGTLLALMVAASLASTAGCSAVGGGITSGSSPYTQGSGVRTTVQRTLGAYHTIDAATGVNVVVHAGTAGAASVTADDNLLGQVVTEVRDGTLYVRIEGGIRSSAAPRVEVANSEIDAVAASTGATIDAESLSSDSLAVAVSTGATLRAAGHATSLSVASTTGATADARNVEARTVDVQVSTGGSARVYPTESITGTCSGGSTLRVRGKPARNEVVTDVSSTMSDGQ